MDRTLLTGLILISPILLIRFLLTSFLGKQALKRAAFFPPTEGFERIAYLINILTTFALLVLPFFLRIKSQGFFLISGSCLLIIALIFYIISIIQFAKPNSSGLNVSGLYRISRNPMYVSFFLYFLACCILTGSWLLFIVLVIFQISVHFLIISEERWCKTQFGQAYIDYFGKVRRYI
jgi:protein-S-isoprenylcysteine O-methyltransferase Ste14